MRRKTVRLKLNTIKSEFKDKVVLLIDDSIVRGTTSMELVMLAREAGAKKVYFASAAPPVMYPNVYGIDIPTRAELVAYGRNEEEIARVLGADRVIYNDLQDVEESVRSVNPERLNLFDSSCFNGKYITEEVTEDYLRGVEQTRQAKSGTPRHGAVPPTAVAAATAAAVGAGSKDSPESASGGKDEAPSAPSPQLGGGMPRTTSKDSICEGLHNDTNKRQRL